MARPVAAVSNGSSARRAAEHPGKPYASGIAGFHYITAISKPQIEMLLDSGILQMELFDQALGEVIGPAAGTAPPRRYVMRRNPVRREEMAHCREFKAAALARALAEAKSYLQEHPRAKPVTALPRHRGGWRAQSAARAPRRCAGAS